MRRRFLCLGSGAVPGRVHLDQHRRRPPPRARRSLDIGPLCRVLRAGPLPLRRVRHRSALAHLRLRQLCAGAVQGPPLSLNRPQQHRDRAERLRQLHAGTGRRIHHRRHLHARLCASLMAPLPGRQHGEALKRRRPRAAHRHGVRVRLPLLLQRAHVPQRHLHELERQRVPFQQRHVPACHGQHSGHSRTRRLQRRGPRRHRPAPHGERRRGKRLLRHHGRRLGPGHHRRHERKLFRYTRAR